MLVDGEGLIRTPTIATLSTRLFFNDMTFRKFFSKILYQGNTLLGSRVEILRGGLDTNVCEVAWISTSAMMQEVHTSPLYSVPS